MVVYNNIEKFQHMTYVCTVLCGHIDNGLSLRMTVIRLLITGIYYYIRVHNVIQLRARLYIRGTCCYKHDVIEPTYHFCDFFVSHQVHVFQFPNQSQAV